MSTQITTQKILAFDEYADFPSTGIEGYVYIDKTAAEAYLWDSTATPPVYVRIGEDTPIPPDPTPLTFVDAATVGALSFAPNYSNGTGGVGATLTATQVGMLRDTSGTGKIDSSYIPVVGGIILIKNQVDQKQNGIYSITTVGSPDPGGTLYQLTRVVDFDQSAELFPLQVNVLQGTANANLYFNQATNPVTVGTSNIVFNPASYVSPSGVIAFVDVATTAALPTCTYANGTLNPSFPGLNATLTANAAGSVLTVDGLTASTSNVPLGTFTRVLVKDQANKAHNGDYIVVNPGSATARWQLRRINYGASGFYRFSRFFMVSNTQASLAGKIYITKQQDPALSNLGIGTQNIDLVEYGGGNSGPVGIANSSGVYTYYATLTLAMAAAISGQTIEVFADILETGSVEIVLKDGVNIQGNGHTYTLNNAGTIHAFKTADFVTPTQRSLSILNLTVIRLNGTGTLPFSDSSCLYLGGYTTGEINCSGSIFNNKSGFVGIIGGTNSTISLNYATAYSTNVFGAIAIGSSFGFRLNHCIGYGSSGGFGIRCHNGGDLNMCTGYSDSGTGIYGDQGFQSNCVGISVSGIGFQAGGTRAINCVGRSITGTGLDTTNAVDVTNCTGISVSGRGINNINFSIYSCTGISSSNFGGASTNSPSGINLHASLFKSTSSVPLQAPITTTVDSCSIVCLWASPSGYGITSNTGSNTLPTMIVNTSFRLSNALAPYLFMTGGSGQAITTANNTYRGGAAYAVNLTQGTLSIQDAQGNIFL
jgi:hypothetical protein